MTAVAGMVMSHQTLFNEGLIAPAAGSAISRQTSALRPPGDASAAELCLTQGHTPSWAAQSSDGWMPEYRG